jgi:hypothetical protein
MPRRDPPPPKAIPAATPEIAEQQQQGRAESIKGPLRSNNPRGRKTIRARSQHPTQTTPRPQSDWEKEHYGGDPTSGSDLERMRAGGGLATGRPSPRIPKRVNVANAVLVERGLADPGDVDPNQGRLFGHAEMGKLTKTDKEMAEQTGVPYRRPAGQGWMTGVGRTKRAPYDTAAEARAAGDTKAEAAIHARKAEVGQQAKEKVREPDTGEPSQTPVRTAMSNRARYESDRPTTWYAGEATQAVEREALKSGLGGHPQGFNIMRRATALLSPQKPWDMGHHQDDNYTQPNVEVAGHLVRFLRGEQARLGEEYDPDKAAKEFRMPGVGHTEETPNLVQGQSLPMRKAVARHLDKPTHEEPKLATEVQKVRNFDPALAAGHRVRWARRQALQRYTSDTHDIRAAGITGLYQSFVGSNAPGGYEFAAMTGRRGAMRQSVRALKEGRDPRTSSEYQENVWVGKRGPNQPRVHKGPGGTGRQVLFEQNKKTGQEKPARRALPPKKK